MGREGFIAQGNFTQDREQRFVRPGRVRQGEGAIKLLLGKAGCRQPGRQFRQIGVVYTHLAGDKVRPGRIARAKQQGSGWPQQSARFGEKPVELV